VGGCEIMASQYNGGLFSQPEPRSMDAQHHLDATGLLCPEPVMMLHNKVRDMAPGELLEVRATDPSTERDIPKFCQFLGHTLEKQQVEGEVYWYWIRKKQ